MKTGKTKRFLSLLLTLAMIFTALPLSLLPAAAADTDNAAAWPTGTNAVTINTSAIRKKEGCTKEEAFKEAYRLLREALKNSSVRYIRLEDNIQNDESFGSEYTLEVSGEKHLDLNGCNLEIWNNLWKVETDKVWGCNHYHPPATLFVVKKNASLTIYDTSAKGTGRINYNSDLIRHEECASPHPSRHVIQVKSGGSLTVNGGTIEAGRTISCWNFFSGSYVRQYVSGAAVTAEGGSTVVINGGKFISRGLGTGESINSLSNAWLCSTLVIKRSETAETKIDINDGEFLADAGGHCVCYAEGYKNIKLTVRGGKFTCDKNDEYYKEINPYKGGRNYYYGSGKYGETFKNVKAQTVMHSGSEIVKEVTALGSGRPELVIQPKTDTWNNVVKIKNPEGSVWYKQSVQLDTAHYQPLYADYGNAPNSDYNSKTAYSPNIVAAWQFTDSNGKAISSMVITDWNEPVKLSDFTALNSSTASAWYKPGEYKTLTCTVYETWKMKNTYDIQNSASCKIYFLDTAKDSMIAGTVHYTSSAVFGRPISTSVTGLPTSFNVTLLTRQWQRSTDSGTSWTNISGAKGNTYTPTANDMGENVRLRVRMTADGWFDELVSAPVKVSKAANNTDPGFPTLTVDKKSYTVFAITDFDSTKEYVYSESVQDGWPSSGKSINSDKVSGLVSGKTYYVYVRYKGTDTTESGTVVRSSSVLMGNENRLYRLILSDSEGNTYTDYGAGNTVYVKKGKSVTLNVAKNPSGANKWSTFSVDYSPESQNPHAFSLAMKITDNEYASITVKGNSVGSGAFGAYYNDKKENYGKWKVVVYNPNDVQSNQLSLAAAPQYENITLSMNDTATLPTGSDLPELLPANSGYTLEWRIPWSSTTGGGYKSDDGNIKLENGTIVPLKAHEGTKKTNLVLVAVKGKEETPLSPTCSFSVTVTDTPNIALTGLAVYPAKSYLDTKGNNTVQLTAEKTPVNAEGTLTWNSSNTGIAKVDNNGKVTAVATGKAVITVSCGGKTATCTVFVNHEHSYGAWTSVGTVHRRTCSSCGSVDAGVHSFTKWVKADNDTHTSACDVNGCNAVETANHTWVYDANQSVPATLTEAGKAAYTCFCGATKTEIVPAISEGSSPLLKGDIDGDDKVSVGDARLVLRAAVGLDTLTGIQLFLADVDGKDGVKVADARLVLRMAVALDPLIYSSGYTA